MKMKIVIKVVIATKLEENLRRFWWIWYQLSIRILELLKLHLRFKNKWFSN